MKKRNFSRRSMLKMAAGIGAAKAAVLTLSSCAAEEKRPQRIVNNRIRQSVAYWCFQKHWSVEQTCRIARELGIGSVELLGIEGPDKFKGYWNVLREYGLVDAMHYCHSFEKGLNNPENWDMCLKALRDGIEACSVYGFPNVLTFTGPRWGIPGDVGIKNCVTALKEVMGQAEKKKVNVCLEMLNSKINIEMEGHPGYQGDHLDYCMEIIRQVGSSRMKLLFDIYHVQIMDGDIITNIRRYKDYIAHYHTAGVPGRNEIDDKQEINYRAVMEYIVTTGYTGYVGQEFIPASSDPLESLRQAVLLCDV